jgi:hypothetical protein
MALVKTSGIPYNNGKNTVSYVALILFNRWKDKVNTRKLPIVYCIGNFLLRWFESIKLAPA